MRKDLRLLPREFALSVLLGLVWLYQRLVSPLFAGSCRFEPSCSEYARLALLAHGPLKGSLLALWRVLRCQPLCRGGFDPVPPRTLKNLTDLHAS